MRNYTGLAVWGCLMALLTLEFVDFGSPSKSRTAKSGSIQPAPAAASSAIPAGDDAKAMAPKSVVKAGPSDKRSRESLHVPFAHIRAKGDGSISYRQ